MKTPEAILKALDAAFDDEVKALFHHFVLGLIETGDDKRALGRFAAGMATARQAYDLAVGAALNSSATGALAFHPQHAASETPLASHVTARQEPP